MASKRIIARLLAAALVALALVPVVAATALADEEITVDLVQYTLHEDGGNAWATVSSGPDYPGTVTIRDSVPYGEKSYTVTAIGKEAFLNCNHLKSVGIPASVTSIGEGAFKFCTSLSLVKFAQDSQLEMIGVEAFAYCSSLESIAIPATVREIGDAAFSSTGLESVELPEGLTSISQDLFDSCSNLTQVTIPSTVTSIGDFAFYGCGAFSTVVFGGSQLQWAAIEWGEDKPDIVSVRFGKFDVTFDSRGGSAVPFQAVAPGGKATEPQAPLKDGMLFGGWYTDEGLAKPFEFSTTIGGDLVLHAGYRCAGDHQWEQKIQKATPTADGRVYQKCSVCDAEEAVPLPKVGTIKLAKTSFTYTGKAIQPKVTVANASGALSADCYTVSYSNNEKAGTASAKVTLKGAYYEGSKTLKFTIAKAANPLSAKAKTKKAVAVKAGKALAAKKLFKVSKAKGKVAYKKAKGSKKISVAKDGRVSVKKGCKAGTYALTVKVRAAGDANHKASAWKAVKVKVKVG